MGRSSGSSRPRRRSAEPRTRGRRRRRASATGACPMSAPLSFRAEIDVNSAVGARWIWDPARAAAPRGALSSTAGSRDGGANAGTRPVDLATGGAANFTISCCWSAGSCCSTSSRPSPPATRCPPRRPGRPCAALTAPVACGAAADDASSSVAVPAVAVVVLCGVALACRLTRLWDSGFHDSRAGPCLGAPSRPAGHRVAPFVCLVPLIAAIAFCGRWTDTPLAAVGAAHHCLPSSWDSPTDRRFPETGGSCPALPRAWLTCRQQTRTGARCATACCGPCSMRCSSSPSASAASTARGRPVRTGVRPVTLPLRAGRSRPCARGRTTPISSRGGSGPPPGTHHRRRPAALQGAGRCSVTVTIRG